MLIALCGLAANVALKVVLFRPLGAVGLATATSVGLWINFGALIALAIAQDKIDFDAMFGKTAVATIAAAIPLALVAILLRGPALALGAHFGGLANLVALFVLGVVGALVYGAALVGALRLLSVSLPALRLRRAS
jgi:putative peptidoglycan lipid II flippase